MTDSEDKPKKRPHNGPRKGAGAGVGWGGPAKGSSGKPAIPFGVHHPDKANGPAPELVAAKVAREAENAAKAQALKDHIFELAVNAAEQTTQLSASIAWLNRHEGMPTQKIAGDATQPLTIHSIIDDGRPPIESYLEEWHKPVIDAST
jgi:hypothetical protein